ncbi:MAG: 3-phosphoshikimate 1-carboxyvinyltransferase [Candidatus Caldarchaeum sp.]|nr:3-phosphoshikimate 1-carboxyvinyltransferase [Candidatus Caldarchaeum sp.]
MKTALVSCSKVEGAVEAPPSKSYTHRAFAIATLTSEKTTIHNPLISRDTIATITASQMLGATIREKGGVYEVVGLRRFRTPDNVIDVMNSGTTLRLYTGLSTLVEKGYTVLTGDESIRRRPMAALLQSLNEIGAECWSTKQNGAAPVVVKGGNRIGGATTIKGTESSQYVSSLLVTGLNAHDQITVHVKDELVSKPYVEATIQMVKLFGGQIDRKGFEIFRTWPQTLHGIDFTVPGDFSSAAFIAAAAHLTQGRVIVKNVSETLPQADSKIVEIVKRYGSDAYFTDDGLVIEGGRRHVDADVVLTDSPDLLPVTAAIAAVNDGVTRIRGVAHARLKESDRISTVASEIRKLNIEVEEHDDGLTIHGSSKTAGGVAVDTYGDHRLFMAFTVLGLALEKGLAVKGAESADVSYPGFLTDLKALGAKITVI